MLVDLVRDEAPEVQRLRALLVAIEDNAHFHVCELDAAQPSELWGRDAHEPLNAFVEALGLGYARAPVSQWYLLTRDEARSLLCHGLQWEQAYASPRLKPAVAGHIATAFVELFADPAQFFSNGTCSQTPTGLRTTAWSGSVTLATFETGVVAVAERRIGLLYLADED